MDITFIEQDLKETEPQDIDFPPAPYSDTNTLEEKVLIAYHCLQRSLRLKSRTLSLVNAYFIGKAINQEIDVYRKQALRRKLTHHYRIMVDNVYDLFEVNPLQMLRTKFVTVQEIRKMKRAQILFLRETIG